MRNAKIGMLYEIADDLPRRIGIRSMTEEQPDG